MPTITGLPELQRSLPFHEFLQSCSSCYRHRQPQRQNLRFRSPDHDRGSEELSQFGGVAGAVQVHPKDVCRAPQYRRAYTVETRITAIQTIRVDRPALGFTVIVIKNDFRLRIYGLSLSSSGT